ncbi:hypothetical protein SDC9_171875 [bioreactor metagenome]|uniref:Uncharacterized protein n=1 Tax=bioreactor metagenome TaxID=1076179 RepID=A0A645GE99_9ZZZZ
MDKIGDYLEIHELNVSAAPVPTRERPDRAVIRGFLRARTSMRVLYIASLELDGMEMVEAFRLNFAPEGDGVELPDIFVINPIRSEEPGHGDYTVVLKIYASGGRVHEFSRKIKF